MKMLQYISPSRISKWKESREAFYVRYMAIDRPEDDPQTQPMSIGSSFDAYCKSYLYEKLFGKGHDPRFDFQAIFEAQVESQHRDWALDAGKYAFEVYQKCGALADLLLDLQQAVNAPRFEIEIQGVIKGSREAKTTEQDGIPFLGKPDVFFINAHALNVTIDWKVNGFCSKYPKSPMAGYVRLRNDKKKDGHHKDCSLLFHKGMMINCGSYLEQHDDSWATQLAIYSWLSGTDIGEDFVVGIDQLACNTIGQPPNRPNIRVAEHRTRISPTFQRSVFAIAQEIWDTCKSDHFFRDMTKEESQQRCLLLDQQAAGLRGDGSAEDEWYKKMTAREY